MQPYTGFSDGTGSNGLLGIGGLTQVRLDSISDEPVSVPQSSENMFHQSLLKSLDDLLASEAAVDQHAQLMSTAGTAASSTTLPSYAQPYGGVSLSSTHQLSQEAIEMLAASHLQLLAQQQAMAQQQQQAMAQQQQVLAQQQAMRNQQINLMQNAGTAVYVTADNAAQLGLSGWAGHRVVTLPGEMQPMAALYSMGDLGQVSDRHLYSPISLDGPDCFTSLTSLSHEQPRGSKPNSSQSLSHQSVMITEEAVRRNMARVYGAGSGRHAILQPEPQAKLRTIAPTAVRTAAPSWADAGWDPQKNVQQKAREKAGTGVFLPTGTGVFLPPGDDEPRPEQRKPVASKQQQPAAKLSMTNQSKPETQPRHVTAKAKEEVLQAESYDDLPASMLA